MKIPRFRSHRSWSELSSAYADGALDSASAGRFTAHLAGCARCQAEASDFKALRAALVRLPDQAAPRSFHVTPAMLLEPARDEPLPSPAGGGATRVAMVAARLTAGVAAAGLAALMVVDFGGVGESGDDAATSASIEMSQITASSDGDAAAGSLPADESVTQESFASATATAMDTLEPTAPVETPDTSGAGTGGGENSEPAGTPEPTPQPPSTGSEDDEEPSDTVEDAGRQTANHTSAYDPATESALTQKSADDSDGIGRGWLRGGQVALGVLLAAAIGAIVFLPARRNTR